MRVRFTQYLEGPAEGRDALAALVLRNLGQLRRQRFPPLYQSRIRYKTGRAARAHWQTLRELHRSGSGDCADLAAARVAELRHSGEDRAAVAVPKRTGRKNLYHVIVVRGDGRIEDPSRALGMQFDGY